MSIDTNRGFAVSVVIPVFNGGLALRRCLDALCRQQTRHAFEVIVVDDASREDLSTLPDEYAQRLALSLIRLEKNSGPGCARNAGVARATGEIVLFTDSDCAPAADWVEKMLAPFADSQVTGVKGVYISNQNDLWARLAQLEFEERYEKLATCSEIDFIDTYSGAYRKSAFAAAGGFNPELRQNEDVDLAFRIKASGAKFVFVPDAVVAHTHREGWRAYASLKFWRGYWRMRIYRQHLNKAGNDSYTPFSLKAQLLLLVVLPLTLLSKNARFLWKSCWLASCLPLMRSALPDRLLLAVVSPLFCLVRGLALLSGMVAGLLAMSRGR
jgi:GT2 family glycosyltransferase